MPNDVLISQNFYSHLFDEILAPNRRFARHIQSRGNLRSISRSELYITVFCHHESIKIDDFDLGARHAGRDWSSCAAGRRAAKNGRKRTQKGLNTQGMISHVAFRVTSEA